MSKKINLSMGNPEDFADAYQEKYYKMISKNVSDFYDKKIYYDEVRKNVIAIIDKIYKDGFNDGYNEKEAEIDHEDKRQGRNDI